MAGMHAGSTGGPTGWATSFRARTTQPVSGGEHLLELFRYIALNPVSAGLCSDPAEWRWSSYAATIGLADAPSFLTLDLARSLFGTAGLRSFVAAVLSQRPQPA